jgi:hypothetical protein
MTAEFSRSHRRQASMMLYAACSAPASPPFGGFDLAQIASPLLGPTFFDRF